MSDADNNATWVLTECGRLLSSQAARVTGVYAIQNRVNGKRYVGSAVNIASRWAAHICHLNAGRHHSKKLQASWNKHRAQTFVLLILEVTEKAALAEREQHWIDITKASSSAGFNILPNARSTIGRIVSGETKAKQSAAMKGRIPSPARRHQLIEALRFSWMREMPPEERERRAKAATGKKHSEETLTKMRRNCGKKLSLEHIAKLSAANRGRKLSTEHAAAKLRAHIGAKRSEASKRKMSLAQATRFRTKPPSRDVLGRLIKSPS